MKKSLFALAPLLLAFSFGVSAEEKYNHFPSLEAPNLQAAICNIQNYNKKLTAITNKAELEPVDMVKVHELTYTLENAVIRLQQELQTIAADLEQVHLASERLDPKTINEFGKKYLSQTTTLIDSQQCAE